MTIQIVQGCLLEAFEKGDVTTIVQGVNCAGVMGSGLAKSIRDKYPIVYTLYRDLYTKYSDTHFRLLGEIQNINMEGYLPEATGDNAWIDRRIVNVFSQEDYGYSKRQVNYGALGKAFTAMSYGLTQASDVALMDYDIIGFPYKFASDRGGADWSIVLEMIDFHFEDFQVKIYKL